jgi:isopropylmalate/homocitrate/citramalate synthase
MSDSRMMVSRSTAISGRYFGLTAETGFARSHSDGISNNDNQYEGQRQERVDPEGERNRTRQ